MIRRRSAQHIVATERGLLPHPVKLALLVISMVVLTLVVTLAPAADGQSAAATLHPQRQLELVRFVRHDCGSCHGLTMRGGLGPALLPLNISEKDREQLRFVILHGRRGTAMPPWSRFLSEAEAAWIAERLLAGFPDAR